MNTHGSSTSARFDAPPRFADPRRVGTLVGLFGSYIFVFSYTPGFDDPLSITSRVLVLVAIACTLWFLFAAPRYLGRFRSPRNRQIGIYLLCVVMEFALIAFGTGQLTSAGKIDLQPALIALVVGLHFIPFAWAFKERMFYLLGGVLALIGGVGLLIGTPTAALAAAVPFGPGHGPDPRGLQPRHVRLRRYEYVSSRNTLTGTRAFPAMAEQVGAPVLSLW